MGMLETLQSSQTHVESMWIDRCVVKTYQQAVDPVTHITSQAETVLAQDVPCKLSYSSFPATEGGVAAGRVLSVKLFLSPLLSIPSGSVIEVTTHAGAVETYESSGAAAKYTNHQEINLVARKDKA